MRRLSDSPDSYFILSRYERYTVKIRIASNIYKYLFIDYSDQRGRPKVSSDTNCTSWKSLNLDLRAFSECDNFENKSMRGGRGGFGGCESEEFL